VRSLIPVGSFSRGGGSASSAEELLRGLITGMYQHAVRDPRTRAILRMLIAESGKFPELAETHYREVIRPGLRMVRKALAQGMASGEFRRTAAAFPQVLMAPGLLAAFWKLLFAERHRLDPDAYLEAHLDFVLRGLRRGDADKRMRRST